MFLSRSALLAVAATVFAGCIAGCASAPTGVGVPNDLTVEATVVRGRDVPDHPEAHRRAARFVLFADGSLHYADEDDADFRRGSDWLPERTRAIGPEAMAAMWAMIERLGLADPENTEPPMNLNRIEAPAGSLTYVVSVTAGRRSRVAIENVLDAAPESEPVSDERSVELVRALARLAWASDLPDSHIVTAPRRYDFGPDPYARFRRP